MSLTNRSLQTIKTGQVIWDEKLSGFGARKQTSDWKSYIPKRRNKKLTFGIKSVLKDAYEEIHLSKYDKSH